MLAISKLRNPIRNYPWGSRTAIAELLGRPVPAPEPEAELWMGDHPQAPSEVRVEGGWQSLPETIAAAPEAILGSAVAERWGARLPFLLKVLAAAEPLSIQAHPDREQARAGFRREEAQGVGERSYSDPMPKAELLYPLTPFRILHGFRPVDEILALSERFGLSARMPPAVDLERFFTAFMTLGQERIEDIVGAACARAEELAGDEVADCILHLAARHAGDRGVLAPLVMNLRELRPGEAIFTPPGVIHSYLEGVGVEIMTSSDNVLRGGLTSKRCDVPELLRILGYQPRVPSPLAPVRDAGGGQRFGFPNDELGLTVIELDRDRSYTGARHGVAILLCTAGEGEIAAADSAAAVAFSKGDSLLVPAGVAGYRLSGRAQLFRAEVAR